MKFIAHKLINEDGETHKMKKLREVLKKLYPTDCKLKVLLKHIRKSSNSRICLREDTFLKKLFILRRHEKSHDSDEINCYLCSFYNYITKKGNSQTATHKLVKFKVSYALCDENFANVHENTTTLSEIELVQANCQFIETRFDHKERIAKIVQAKSHINGDHLN